MEIGLKNNRMMQENKPKKISTREYFNFGPVWGYFFRKKDPTRPSTFNLRMMHGINKVSILVFLMAFIVWIIKRVS